MSKRKTLAIIIALMLSAMLSACTVEVSPNYPEAATESQIASNYGTFVVVYTGEIDKSEGLSQFIMYDPNTMVMYTGVGTTYKNLKISKLYNANGTLKVYSNNDAKEYQAFIVVVDESINSTKLYQCNMYDPDTMVMYTYIGTTLDGDFFEMYNADGTLTTYSLNAETD